MTELCCVDCTLSVSDLASALPPSLGILDVACCYRLMRQVARTGSIVGSAVIARTSRPLRESPRGNGRRIRTKP